MKICPSCGRENAEDARFCSACGAALDTAAREERKVVTCLFCDLVGFTARAERMDPEDVRRLLQPYHARVRGELERFGGTVEKFIGDAVMAVFGAPVAHEDDPERAVRAALSIRDALAEEGELEIRIGITTGEALVALGARPEAGEGMASGDVVNTAARIQSAAPTGSVLVDETTYRATERVVEYAEAEPIEAKGKSVPVPVWEARTALARVAVERAGGAPLVGRKQELTLLRETFTRVTREREPQLLTLVGVPGIGKSRLVFELFQTIETGVHGLVFWRHGRSLPYGEGVTFWALSEIVKAQAGILESDGPVAAEDKLQQAVERYIPAAERDWVERHLRPLVGLEADEMWAGDRRAEAFAAWRRLIEALADERPLVLVFEDLHWADDALLDFVDYLVEWASGIPLLVLCTARPELLERRSGWGGGKVNSSTILLSPLTGEETSVLVHSLLGRSTLDADVQTRLLEHAGGNPLYAEEFTRMLTARRGEVVLPETVQGIIAARLDTLPREEKALLQDAAVMGRVFWLGALGRERWELEKRLHSLERKEFVGRSRRSTVADETEYAFRHALVRDVAYEQIPKAERADKHRATAEWIESLGRPEDHAEMLAYHYAAALEYAGAAGQDTSSLAERARTALREAGDRAFGLNAFTAAGRYYTSAVELWPADDPERLEIQFRLARSRHVSGDTEREVVMEDAREALAAAGRIEPAAEVDAMLAEVRWYRGDREGCDRLLRQAATQVEHLAPSPAKAHVLGQVARYRMLAGEYEDAVRIGTDALTMAERLCLDELRAHALNTIGTGKANQGDAAGVADLEQSLEIAKAARSPEAARALNNLGSVHSTLGDFRRSAEYFAEAVRVGEELGALAIARFSRAQLAGNLLWCGRWEEGLRLAEVGIAESESNARFGICRNRARVLLARGEVDAALADASRVLERAGEMKDPQVILPALTMGARIYAEIGRLEDARSLAAELMQVANPPWDWKILDFAFVAAELGHADALRLAIKQSPTTRWTSVLLALLDGHYGKAADLLREMGVHFSEADARMREAEKLAGEGRRAEADEQLRLALAFYRSVGAVRFVREGEALLAAAS